MPKRHTEQSKLNTDDKHHPFELNRQSIARIISHAPFSLSRQDGAERQRHGGTAALEAAAPGLWRPAVSIADLQRLAAAVHPKALVPIHTFEPERFPELFENVVLRQDGDWWEV